LQLLEKRKELRRISSLSAYLSKVQDNAELPKIDETYEGTLHILQSEIYKTANMLQMEFTSEQEKNRLMNELLTNVSHQIKTPLAAITIMTDNLERGNLSDRQRQICIRRIRQQTDHITALVRNLLVSSEIDAGVFKAKMEEIPLKQLVDKAADPLSALLEIKGIDFKTDIPREIIVKADQSWFSEAVSNILKNCIEHTPEGGEIRIRAGASILAADLLIEDTGEGMDEETLEHVFERFYKSGGNPDSNGIGMYLAKQIIQIHNGTIDVQSRINEGTSFRIRLFFTETI
jgi:signal transduction histidine kinase